MANYSAKNFLAQVQAAAQWRAQEHARLLAEGWEWDGMDGYSKTVNGKEEELKNAFCGRDCSL